MRTSPPLSPELEALLAPHRTVMPLAPSVGARAIARAAATTPWGTHVAGRVSARPAWVFAAAAGLVLALGAGAYAGRAWIAASPSLVRAPAVPTIPPRTSDSLPAAVALPERESGPQTVAPHVRRVVGKAHTAPGLPTNEELQLLRAAREDVTRGDFARALAVLSEHARRFRNGVLVEEREALRVKSLAGLGRREEAQRTAADFHARFPHSVLLATFERMKGSDR